MAFRHLPFEPSAPYFNGPDRQHGVPNIASGYRSPEFFRRKPKQLINTAVVFTCAGVNQPIAAPTAEKSRSGRQI